MSAARVLNPMINEFCKVTSSPHTLRTNLTCSRQLTRIKRDLFGPVNSVELKKMVNEDLEKHQEEAAKRWGFDFRTGTPLANSRYIWERVSMQESCIAPEMYTLTRAAHVRPLHTDAPEPKTQLEILMDERADRENFGMSQSATDTDSCDESQDESSMVVFKVPAGPNNTEATLLVSNKPQLRKRQPKITEYMKERKRLTQTPKKVSPAKRLRTSSGSSTTSATHFNHAVNANSIAAHFSIRTQRHN